MRIPEVHKREVAQNVYIYGLSDFPETIFPEQALQKSGFGIAVVSPNGFTDLTGSGNRIWRYYTASECDFPKCIKWEIDLEHV